MFLARKYSAVPTKILKLKRPENNTSWYIIEKKKFKTQMINYIRLEFLPASQTASG